MDIDLNPDFLDFIKALNANSVDYLVVGGYAVIFPSSINPLLNQLGGGIFVSSRSNSHS
ncbi:MAG: hypothetical protein O3C43_10145 [Verrucomicrobia bacterium]|nr:hypothetical protein [Verrucomicrobiota bacterium]MDA1066853.1 hypothetical protein [Verrucomicrobiota bacterium]